MKRCCVHVWLSTAGFLVWMEINWDGVSDTQGPGGRGSHSVYSASMYFSCPGGNHNTRRPSAIEHTDCSMGQTNKQAHWAILGVCATLCPPDLNLICRLLVLLNAAADMEPSRQPLRLLFEKGGDSHKRSIFQTMSTWAYGLRHIWQDQMTYTEKKILSFMK